MSYMQSQILNLCFSKQNLKPSAQIYLTRHCKTQWNLDGIIQGTIDLSLCNRGRREAELMMHNLEIYNFDLIISSPMKRAFETACIYSNHLDIPIIIKNGFKELDHGKWQGRVINEMLSDNECRYRNWLDNPLFVPIPGGSETIIQAQKRIITDLNSIKTKIKDKKVLIITHKHIRAILNCALLGTSLSRFKDLIDEKLIPVSIN
ncbi:MAG: histidine phosphatase family protein [archaeon]|nr:histidine phosphatase family protein [archaeon]